MKTFEEYLEKQGYTQTSIQGAMYKIERFNKWLEQQQLNIDTMTYQNAVEYISYLQEECHLQPLTINLCIPHLKHYFNFHQTTCPFVAIKVRGEKKKVRKGMLTPQELEEMYLTIPNSSLLEKRDKILAGLFIFQGITTSELPRQTLAQIDVNKAKIHIVGSMRSNDRSLPIHPLQIMELIQHKSRCRKQKYPSTTLLFQTFKGGKDYKGIVRKMVNALKEVPRFDSVRQIRQSVIINWLQHENLRQVQYNAGHRFISSTESYRRKDVRQLQTIVLQNHPFC